MKPNSFERSRKNPYALDSEPTDESLEASETPEKPESDKKEKNAEKKEKKTDENKKEEKDEKKRNKDKNKDKKDSKKPHKLDKNDEDLLEIKKNKRQQLVERSFRYKKFYEEAPIPHDPWVIARLMVAEHLLALHEQIEQPAVDATPTEEQELLATFDYMGIIADKLEDPDVESTPEIQETYETIIHLAEETLREDEDHLVETLITTNNEEAHVPQKDLSIDLDHTETQPSAPSSMHLPASAAALVAVLLYARQQTPKKTRKDTVALQNQPDNNNSSSPYRPTGIGGSTSIIGATTSHQPATNEIRPTDTSSAGSIHTTPRQPSRLETPPRIEHPPHSHESPSHISPRTPETLASLAVTTALVSYATPGRSSTAPAESSPGLTSHRENAHIASASSTQNHPVEKPVHRIETPSFNSTYDKPASIQKPHFSHPAPTVETHATSGSEYSSHKKIEHLPLESLLAMAEAIPVGHGQRLRHAYEKGMIDKDGLVKVLKSHTKHHDFLQEFRQQVVRKRNLVQSSPEFLTPSQPKDNQFHQETTRDSPSDQMENPSSEKQSGQPSAIPSWPDFPNPVKNTPDTDPFNMHEQKTLHSAWFGIAIIGIFILAIVLLIFFFLLR